MGFPNEVSYGAAKAALENYTMAAAFELAPLGITANVVHPPVTDTGWVTDEVRRHVKERHNLTPNSPSLKDALGWSQRARESAGVEKGLAAVWFTQYCLRGAAVAAGP